MVQVLNYHKQFRLRTIVGPEHVDTGYQVLPQPFVNSSGSPAQLKSWGRKHIGRPTRVLKISVYRE